MISTVRFVDAYAVLLNDRLNGQPRYLGKCEMKRDLSSSAVTLEPGRAG